MLAALAQANSATVRFCIQLRMGRHSTFSCQTLQTAHRTDHYLSFSSLALPCTRPQSRHGSSFPVSQIVSHTINISHYSSGQPAVGEWTPRHLHRRSKPPQTPPAHTYKILHSWQLTWKTQTYRHSTTPMLPLPSIFTDGETPKRRKRQKSYPTSLLLCYFGSTCWYDYANGVTSRVWRGL